MKYAISQLQLLQNFTRLDKIVNDHTQQELQVRHIKDKIEEAA